MKELSEEMKEEIRVRVSREVFAIEREKQRYEVKVFLDNDDHTIDTYITDKGQEPYFTNFGVNLISKGKTIYLKDFKKIEVEEL